jgi:hypothetical protein
VRQVFEVKDTTFQFTDTNRRPGSWSLPTKNEARD